MDQNNGGIIGKINTPTTTVASGVWSLDSQFESQAGSTWPLAFPQTTIANALRFNDGSSDYLNRTPASAGNKKTFTYSGWVKRSSFSDNDLFNAGTNSGNNIDQIHFNSDNKLRVYSYGGSYVFQYISSQVFRDISAWYHIVVAVDTTQATASSRVKIYVNGNLITNFSTETDPSLNADVAHFNSTNGHYIGSSIGSTRYFDGYMAEVVFIDGQALEPTSFGVFNTVSNIWEPRPYTGTYGNNGFRLDFSDSSALGDDVSGNGNDFTVNNLTSIDQVTDTCSNNFATMNPIASQAGSNTSSSVATFSDGNLVVDAVVSETVIANIGVDTGKWFWEVKVLTDQDGIAIGGANQHFHLDAELGYNSPSSPSDAKIFTYNGNGQKATTVGDGSQFSSYGNAIAVNDIIGVALNLDDDEVTYYKNGTAQNSGTPISLTALGSGEQYFPAVGNWSASSIKVSFNFGSPAFTISSGNSDANGFGNFEYSVPSGYFALCTKNLAEYG